MSRFRAILLVVCCLALAGLLVLGRLAPRADQPPAAASAPGVATNADCRQCHPQVWEEWEASYHSRAWADDAVQAAFRHFGHDRQCESCHAPEPVFQRGLAAPPALRATDRESGVNCLSCHGLPDGRVAARRSLPAAPCQPVATPELTRSGHCAGCHVAIHKDWQASSFAAAAKTCHDCHMPAVTERPGGRSHVYLGGHDPVTIRSGAEMECRQEEDQLAVVVRNHATGHNFPGERHNRVLLLQVIQRQADGTITLAEQRTIKDITPFRGESSAEQIRAGQAFTARFAIVQPPVTADVRLLYKAFPWYPDRDALIVHQSLVELREP